MLTAPHLLLFPVQRFGNPTALNTTFDGSFDATSYGNVCPGYGVSSYPNVTAGQDYTVSEDCLNINVIRPAGTTESDRLPVLVWIFGGGLVQGTANDPRYNGTYLVKRSVEIGKPIIFASIKCVRSPPCEGIRCAGAGR